ncbi:MAG: spore coat protein [Candidatus Saccharibacteria bacterium]
MSKDSEWMGILLYQHKLAAGLLTDGILESSDTKVRSHFENMFDKCVEHHKHIFDVMNQKGWYKVEPAPQDQLSRVQQSFSTLTQQMQQM